MTSSPLAVSCARMASIARHRAESRYSLFGCFMRWVVYAACCSSSSVSVLPDGGMRCAWIVYAMLAAENADEIAARATLVVTSADSASYTWRLAPAMEAESLHLTPSPL